MSKWKTAFRIVEIIIALSSLFGWIYSWLSDSETYEFFGKITMGPFEWYLIFQASVIAIIVINWPRVVRLWKRYTKRDKHEELELIVGKFLVAERHVEVVGDSNPALRYEYKKAKENLISKLMELDFILFKENISDYEFTEKFKWFVFRLSVELRKTKYNKLRNLWEKTCLEINGEK